MKVTAIMATCGRHLCSERSLAFFLRQSYSKKHLLIYQNSETYQQLDSEVDLSMVTLVNRHIDSTTGEPYTNLGAIYQDSLKYVPSDTSIVTFWDDDDFFLENHLEKGVNGILTTGKTAYKPSHSFFLDQSSNVTLTQNVLEPSIFVKLGHLLRYGFSKTTTPQHLQWLNPLIDNDEIFIDPSGVPTLIYNWGHIIFSCKTSGLSGNPNAYRLYRKMAKQHGDRIICPAEIARLYSDIVGSLPVR